MKEEIGWDDPYCKLYRRVFHPDLDERSLHDATEISAEMRAVVEAPSVREAAAMIEWWGSFSGSPPWNKTAQTVADHLRRTWARMRVGADAEK